MLLFKIRFCIIPILFLVTGIAKSTNANTNGVDLNSDVNQISLDSTYLSVLNDKTSKLSFEDILKIPSGKFHKIATKQFEITNPDFTYWLKFKINKNQNFDQGLILESFDFQIDKFECYTQLADKSVKYIKSGQNEIFSKRTFNHKNFEFIIPDPGTYEQTIYIKIKANHKFQISLVLRTFERFTNYALNEYFLLGIFYGMLLLIAIYNLFLYVTVREKAYLYYVLYVTSISLYAMAQDGTGFQYIWPNFPGINAYAIPLFLYAVVISLLLYTHAFLPVKLKVPILYKATILFILVRTAYLLMAVTYIPTLQYKFLIDLIPFALAYISALTVYQKGFKPARFFIIGFSALFITFLINALMYAGHLSPNIFTVYALNIGVVIEMFMLSAALAERVRIFREDKIAQQLENEKLEFLVQERTTELKDANEKLKVQANEIASINQLLQEDNTRLKKDVQQIAQHRVMQSELNLEEFSKIYPDDESCFNYLAELKWGNGYNCQRCQNLTWSPGKSLHSRRCSKCGYDESLTVNTIFHYLKFPIHKAFYILFLTTQNPEITLEELANKLQLTTKTCWSFRKKILDIKENMVDKGKLRKTIKNHIWPTFIMQKQKKP